MTSRFSGSEHEFALSGLRRHDGESVDAKFLDARHQLRRLAAGTQHVSHQHPAVSQGLHTSTLSKRRSTRSAIIWRRTATPSGQMIEAAVNADQVARPEGPREVSAGERAQDHRRADRVRGRWRVEGKCNGAGAVPGCGRQGHRAIPQARQAGDPVPRQIEDRKSHQSLRGGPKVGLVAVPARSRRGT